MDEPLPTTRNQQLLTQAVNEVMQESPNATMSVESLLEKVSRNFLNKKLDDFPMICDIARVQNALKREELRLTAKRGKFDSHNNTETYWSDERNFMHDYEIPQELYSFMEHFVYKDFWSAENAKVWRPFMKAICDRRSPMIAYDAMNLLIKVKQLYGSNSDLSLTR